LKSKLENAFMSFQPKKNLKKIKMMIEKISSFEFQISRKKQELRISPE